MSKVTFKHIAGIALTAAVISSTTNASPISASGSMDDDYWGGNPHKTGNQDVIGHDTHFNILGMEWSLNGTNLQIKIETEFALSGLGSFNRTDQTNADPNGEFGAGNGIAFGDLFLSSSWNPNGASDGGKYTNDNMTSGTQWEYGFSLDDRFSTVGGDGTWYDLTGCNKNADCIYATDEYINDRLGYRKDQAVAVKTNITTAAANIQSNVWSIEGSDPGKITFNFDIAGTELEHSETIAFHWAMSCGNDTIEGEFTKPVPEPASVALLGLGIAGLALTRRRKQS